MNDLDKAILKLQELKKALAAEAEELAKGCHAIEPVKKAEESNDNRTKQEKYWGLNPGYGDHGLDPNYFGFDDNSGHQFEGLHNHKDNWNGWANPHFSPKVFNAIKQAYPGEFDDYKPNPNGLYQLGGAHEWHVGNQIPDTNTIHEHSNTGYRKFSPQKSQEVLKTDKNGQWNLTK